MEIVRDPSESTEFFSLLAPKEAEKFSFKLMMIIAFVHFSALPALFSVTWFNFFAWATTHTIFATFGLSLGLHRMISHRSFRAHSVVRAVILILATLCFQGGPLFWAAVHRLHHRFTEKFGDAHSASRGFVWSHVGWMCYKNPNGFSYSKARILLTDFKNDKLANWLEKHNLGFNLVVLGLVAILCWSLNHLDTFFWVGPLRIITVWHATWAINSWSHGARFGGARPSGLRNTMLINFILGGEGDHDFHHQRPSSVKHSRNRYHLDFGYMILRTMRFFRLVQYRTPNVETTN